MPKPKLFAQISLKLLRKNSLVWNFGFSLFVCLFVVLRCVSMTSRLVSARSIPFRCVSGTDLFVLAHKFALICCKIISFIYVQPFTWPLITYLRRRVRWWQATNLYKINYQTVTLTYRLNVAQLSPAQPSALLAKEACRANHNLEYHVASFKGCQRLAIYQKRHQTQAEAGCSPLTISCNKILCAGQATPTHTHTHTHTQTDMDRGIHGLHGHSSCFRFPINMPRVA